MFVFFFFFMILCILVGKQKKTEFCCLFAAAQGVHWKKRLRYSMATNSNLNLLRLEAKQPVWLRYRTVERSLCMQGRIRNDDEKKKKQQKTKQQTPSIMSFRKTGQAMSLLFVVLFFYFLHDVLLGCVCPSRM